MVQRFIYTSSSKRMSPLARDRLVWKETKDGIFTIRIGFNLLEGGRPHLELVKLLWNPCVPTKVGFFV